MILSLFLMLISGGGLVVMKTNLVRMIPIDPPFICRAQIRSYITELAPLMEDWDNAIKVAGATSRIALGGQVQRLQSIRRNVAAVKPPVCAQSVHQNLVELLDLAIQGFLAFMSQEPEADVSRYFERSRIRMEVYTEQIQELLQKRMPESPRR